ncbi:MAG: hypothetical protein EA398_04015 [Deltaproteobacteria bacterium]|nr:MAG: hypothetical protein EA398_04015 [Deltaproteobacteria bacterium]
MTIAMTRPWIRGAILLFVLLLAAPALANRPFNTDDARIVEHGELDLETEIALDVNRGDLTPLLGIDAGIGLANLLEARVFMGLGLDAEQEFTLANPGVEAKLLIHRPVPGDMVGVAFVAGAALPVGTGGAYSDATTLYGYIPLSAVNRRETVELHANVGYAIGLLPDDNTSFRAHWGAAIASRPFTAPVMLAFEVGSSDPRDILGPDVEIRLGARYEGLDAVDLDAFFGLLPDYNFVDGSVEAWPWTIGVGATFNFALFGDAASRSGHSQGAHGLVVPSRYRE